VKESEPKRTRLSLIVLVGGGGDSYPMRFRVRCY
jgi:hypothetical protein